ncbi:MAG: septum formation protein Maf [Oscillospiraceae bacterium]|nr:septum formation protein Maf [Oscillospiraceae bacterium]
MAVYLASTSPRRKELLAVILPQFNQLSPQVEEKEYPQLTPREKAVRLSKDKCIAAVNHIREKGMVIIASDTVVDLDGKVLEKPKDRQDAVNMISALSGKTHHVYSAVTVYKNGKIYTFSEDTAVHFGFVPDDVIQKYVDTSEPYDKAGGYAIQGFMGDYIDRIEGDYYNVVGLPVENLKKLLKFLNIM